MIVAGTRCSSDTPSSYHASKPFQPIFLAHLQPPPTPHPSDIPSQDPLLSQYLVHPLNPLASVEQGVNPIAHDIFEWVLSTLPNPALSASQAALISPANVSVNKETETTGRPATDQWSSLDDLKVMSEAQLARVDKDLRARLSRGSYKAQAIRDEIDAKDQEMDWELRILDETGTGDDGGDSAVAAQESSVGEGRAGGAPRAGDAQEGWSLVDYLKVIDYGRVPLHGNS